MVFATHKVTAKFAKHFVVQEDGATNLTVQEAYEYRHWPCFCEAFNA
jgi:hypothetical protein